MSTVKLNALKKAGSFSGDGDVEQWIDRMEQALLIDGIPESSHAAVLSLHLNGAAYDTWKGLSAEGKIDATQIKTALRSVFGMQKMDAWMKAVSSGGLIPGETVDVAFAELRKLLTIVTKGGDVLDTVAACMLMTRLPSRVRDQVLLQCGQEMNPASVVTSAKQLMSSASSIQYQGGAAVAVMDVVRPIGQHGWKDGRSGASSGVRHGGRRSPSNYTSVECFHCHQRGHIARFCPAKTSTVSGNAVGGQPQV